VRTLRAHQFPEDAGPLAHPVRPDSYIEINNFYTTTVYDKGAEVVRMQAALLGPEIVPARDRSLFRASRRAGRDHRGLRALHGGRQRA
jgi:aminopeptidase N